MSGVILSIRNSSRTRNPSVPFLNIAKSVLPRSYDLSLVFIGDQRSKNLNNKFRKKNKPANVLSFELDATMGEIFINLQKAKREASLFKRNYTDHVSMLFIHALLHLKGYQHGSTMDNKEERIFKRFCV